MKCYYLFVILASTTAFGSADTQDVCERKDTMMKQGKLEIIKMCCAGIFLIAAFLILSANAVKAETLVESSIFFRVAVAYKVDQNAVQEWLPTHWKAASLSKGTWKGTNLIAIFDDKFIRQDGEGKLFKDGAYCEAIFLAFGKNEQTNQFSIFIIRTFWPYDDKGDFKNNVKASVTREAEIKGATSTSEPSREIWKVRDTDGGTLEFQMTYQRSVPRLVKRDAKARSNIDPELIKIYRDERTVDLVMSKPDGINRLKSFELKTTMPEFRKIFDGSEELIGVSVMPARIRQVYVP